MTEHNIKPNDFKLVFNHGMDNLRILLDLSLLAINQHWKNGVENIIKESGVYPLDEFSTSLWPGIYNTLDLKQLLRSTVFVSSYAFFEGFLDGITTHFQHKTPCLVKRTDLRDKGIQRSKNYLVKVIEIPNFFGNSQEWSRINTYAEIRHSLVHASGKVKDEDKRQQINKLPLVRFDDIQVKLIKGFCEHVLDDIESFTKQLFHDLDEFDPNWQEL